MFTRFLATLVLAALAGACAHKGAVKVDCDGPLRPINPPIADSAPVSIESTGTEASRPLDKHP